MELNRKKITNEEIEAFENESIEKCTKIFDLFKQDFENLGYEFELELSWENEKTYDSGDLTQDREYSNGYNSSAFFRVLKIEDAEIPEELLINNDADLENADSESQKALKTRIAYTSVSLVRIYKAFWKETVEFADDFDFISTDLNEFIQKLSEKE